MTRRFQLNSNFRGADEIKDLLISIDFVNRNTELLLLFSIISPWLHKCFSVFNLTINLRCLVVRERT